MRSREGCCTEQESRFIGKARSRRDVEAKMDGVSRLRKLRVKSLICNKPYKMLNLNVRNCGVRVHLIQSSLSAMILSISSTNCQVRKFYTVVNFFLWTQWSKLSKLLCFNKINVSIYILYENPFFVLWHTLGYLKLHVVDLWFNYLHFDLFPMHLLIKIESATNLCIRLFDSMIESMI